MLIADINGQPVHILIDSGAHVSVLPKVILDQLVDLPIQTDPRRPVKAFGGKQIYLDGPVHLNITIGGVRLRHPFYYLDAPVPAIAGYDIMRAARLVLDTHSRIVWSHHPDANQTEECSVITNQGEPVHNSTVSMTHGMSPDLGGSESTLPIRATEGTTSLVQETHPKVLDPSAPPYVPRNNGTIDDDTAATDSDYLPDHLNLLYETTVSNTKLTSTVDRQFRELLTRHEHTFAKSSTDLGYCTVLEHDIDTGDAAPIKQSPRRPPLSAGNAEDQILDEMLQTGVIQPSISEWASPVCLVRKPDGTFRFCIDYRRVNAVSRRDAFPAPEIQDALDSLRGAKHFATLDLLSGYWQLGMTDRARERSAFCTRRGLFEFVRMPFGLSGAPATFCRVMSHVMGDYLWKICLCYIDDLIIFGRTQQELLERLDMVLTRLRDYGLKVKPSKCILFRTEIKFLGHLVTSSGIQPLPEKVQSIKDWPVPRCIRDVRAYYGLVGYYRRYIQNFATIAEPLTRLTKKHTKFEWSPEADRSFKQLKQALLDAPILAFPYPDRPCILDTDSSDVAYGAVISQNVDGQERPIAFYSRVMTPAQMNYCATRRELLAAIAALQHFRHYLLNVQVVLRTDHHSLKWLRTFKRPEGILARWMETLAEFDITIEHRPGRVHCNADSLSRQACKQCWGKLPKTPWVDELQRANDCTAPLGIHALQLLPELSSETLQDLQQQDPILGLIRTWLETDHEPTMDELRECPPEGRKLIGMRQILHLVTGVLVRKDNNITQLIVPEVLRRRLFDSVHAGPLAAHLGADRTLAQLRQSYFWPGMSKDVRLWHYACDICARSKGPPPRAHATMQKVNAAAPMDLVAIDLLSGLPTAQDGSVCILVAVDYMTKWVEAYPLPNEEASTCMTALYNGFFSRFGLPAQLHSDQGRQFESKIFAELSKLAGIRKTRTTPFHPRSDGQVERFNRTLLSMLRASAHDEPDNWPSRVPAILAAYRMTPHRSTGVSPNLAMLGREVCCPFTLIAAPPDEADQLTVHYAQNFRDTMRQAHQRVRQVTQTTAKTQKSYFDSRVKAVSLNKGQLVWLYWPRPLLRQQQRKLTQLWTGPWKVIEFLTDVVVRVQHIKTNKCQTVHVDRLVHCSSMSQVILPPRPQIRRESHQGHTTPTSQRATPTPDEHQSPGTPLPTANPDDFRSTDEAISSTTLTVPLRRSGRIVRKPKRYRT